MSDYCLFCEIYLVSRQEKNKYKLISLLAKICTTGRSADQFNKEGTGNNLYIQNGSNPMTDSILIPHDQDELGKTMWTKSPCFIGMGECQQQNIKCSQTRSKFSKIK